MRNLILLTFGLYRFKAEMWSKVAEKIAIPWRAAEAMHWHLGEQAMARRAGAAEEERPNDHLLVHNQHTMAPTLPSLRVAIETAGKFYIP